MSQDHMLGHTNTGDVASVTEWLPVFWLIGVQPVWAGDLTWSKIASAHKDHCTRMPKICICRGWIHVTCIISSQLRPRLSSVSSVTPLQGHDWENSASTRPRGWAWSTSCSGQADLSDDVIGSYMCHIGLKTAKSFQFPHSFQPSSVNPFSYHAS